jgi:hypothetical protein
MASTCDKPIFVFDCNDERTFYVSVSGSQDRLIESGSVLTLSASDTISPVLCANRVFKFDEKAKNTFAGVAWVSANGNDSTGTIGDSDFPYLTMQAAYNAGARSFHLSAGTFTGLSIVGSSSISILGSGVSQTTITGIALTDLAVSTWVVEDLGVSFLIDTLTVNNLFNSGNTLTCRGLYVTNIIADGSNSTPDGIYGTTLIMNDCRCGTVSVDGGLGTVNGGFAGNISATNSVINTISCDGGPGTVGGDGGTITLSHCDVTELTIDGGTGSTPGAGGILTGRTFTVNDLVSTTGGITIQNTRMATVEGSILGPAITVLNSRQCYFFGVTY